MRFKELFAAKVKEPAMVPDSLAKLREMTRYLMEQEGEKQATGQLSDDVGHSLLNPLSVIKNVARSLNMTLEECDPEVKEMLETLETQVARAERIVNSFLDSPNSHDLTEN